MLQKKYFLNWILVAELLCFMKRFKNKVDNMMTSLQNIEKWPRLPLHLLEPLERTLESSLYTSL